MTKKIDIEGSIQKVIESLYNNKESFLSNSDKYADLLKMAINNLLNDNGVSLLHCITGIQFLFNKGVNNDFQWTRDYMYK